MYFKIRTTFLTKLIDRNYLNEPGILRDKINWYKSHLIIKKIRPSVDLDIGCKMLIVKNKYKFFRKKML